MGVLADWQIARDVKITPFAEGVKRPGKISYGNGSYGYDVRLGYKFQVFKPYPCSVIDPKEFDKRMLEEVDLSIGLPTEHDWAVIRWIDEGKHKERQRCLDCTQLRGGDTEGKPCPAKVTKPDHLLIPPHSFVLAESLETFEIPRDVLCIVLGKSTYARCGLIVNVTPGEPEWKGVWTIELSNTTPLPMKVYPGEGIAQCVFIRSDGVSEVGCNVKNWGWSKERYEKETTCKVSYADKVGKYQSQVGLTHPTVDKENDNG